MKKIRLLVLVLTVMAVGAMTPSVDAQDVRKLESEIEQHEKNIKEKESSIK